MSSTQTCIACSGIETLPGFVKRLQHVAAASVGKDKYIGSRTPHAAGGMKYLTVGELISHAKLTAAQLVRANRSIQALQLRELRLKTKDSPQQIVTRGRLAVSSQLSKFSTVSSLF